MKKSLVKKLVRMAKDGDPEAIEAVAEMLESLAEGEVIESAGEVVEEVSANNGGSTGASAVAEEPAAVIETPEATVVVDEATLGDVLSRLDQIISLLTPAATDETPPELPDEDPEGDPVEEIVEAVGEAAAEAVSEAEAEDPELLEAPVSASPGEVAAMVEEIMEPVLSEVLEPEEPSAEEDCGSGKPAADAATLRAAMAAVRPLLDKLPGKERHKVARNFVRLYRQEAGRKASDGKTYAALANVSRRRPGAVTADLGKQIMAARNANYHG